MDDLRRANRVRAIAIGLVVGVIWFLANRILDIQGKIANSGILPFYVEGVAANILLPMILGAVATAICTFGFRKPHQGETEKSVTCMIATEGAIIGAVGTVAWWVVPLAISGIAQLWLMYSFAFGGVIVGTLSEVVSGSFIIAGGDIGAAVGGGILGGALCVFVVGVARELIGPQSWSSKSLLVVGLVVGVGIGIVYGLVWAKHWVRFPID